MRKSAKKQDLSSGILARPAAIDLGRPSFWTRMVPNAENLNLLYEQADVSFSFKRLLIDRRAASHWPERSSALLFNCRSSPPPVLALSWAPCRSSG